MALITDDTQRFDRLFHVEMHLRGDATVLRLRGELTIDRVPELRRQMRRVVAQRPRRVVVDLSHLTFICAQGLGALLTLRRDIAAGGGSLRVTLPPNPVADLIRITRLAELFIQVPASQPAEAVA